MKKIILLLVFLLLFSGCTKKTDVEPKKEEPILLVKPSAVANMETPPPISDGVLLDDSAFLDTLPKTYEQSPAQPAEPPPEQPADETPQIVRPEKLAIDTFDSTRYLEDGGSFRDAIYLGTKQVGFQITEFSKETIQDHPVHCVVIRNQVRILLQGTPVELSAAHRTYETPQGELVGSQSRIQTGNLLVNQEAKVFEDKLEITSSIDEQSAKKELPWKIGGRIGGACAIQTSLLKNPMQDKEERRVPFYDPTQQVVVDAVLVAKDIEKVELPGQILNLRRIETTFDQIPVTFWTDALGNIIRMSRPFLETETLVTIRTKEH